MPSRFRRRTRQPAGEDRDGEGCGFRDAELEGFTSRANSHDVKDSLNHLDYRVTTDNDLSFELLVDGKVVERLGQVRAIPYWLFEKEDLPSYFNYFRKREEHLLGVCSCGESGCGSAGCVIEKDSDHVRFGEIFVDGYTFPSDYGFRFGREKDEMVMRRITEEVRRFKEANKEGQDT